MSTSTAHRDGDTGDEWMDGQTGALRRSPTVGDSPLANAWWLVLDVQMVAVAALLQALWGPSPLPCAHAGVYVFDALDLASRAFCWLGADDRWYNRTVTTVLPKPRKRTGVVKWMSDRLDPWQ